jgi:hypothetical protein
MTEPYRTPTGKYRWQFWSAADRKKRDWPFYSASIITDTYDFELADRHFKEWVEETRRYDRECRTQRRNTAVPG